MEHVSPSPRSLQAPPTEDPAWVGSQDTGVVRDRFRTRTTKTRRGFPAPVEVVAQRLERFPDEGDRRPCSLPRSCPLPGGRRDTGTDVVIAGAGPGNRGKRIDQERSLERMTSISEDSGRGDIPFLLSSPAESGDKGRCPPSTSPYGKPRLSCVGEGATLTSLTVVAALQP